MVESPSLQMLKKRVDVALKDVVSGDGWWLDFIILRSLFQPL